MHGIVVGRSARTMLEEKLREWISKAPPPANALCGAAGIPVSRRRRQLAGYSAKTISRWIRAGKLRPYGLRGERVKRLELEQLMADLPSDAKTDGAAGETEADIARRIVDGESGPRGSMREPYKYIRKQIWWVGYVDADGSSKQKSTGCRIDEEAKAERVRLHVKKEPRRPRRGCRSGRRPGHGAPVGQSDRVAQGQGNRDRRRLRGAARPVRPAGHR